MQLQLKKYKTLVLIGLLCVLNHQLVSAQETYSPPQVTLPSPKAAEMIRYGEVPIGAYSGTPEINVPIYTAVSGDLSVPISASYNASGIKVNQESGWIGLGWMLNVGGSISRVIRGKDDFGRNASGFPFTNEPPREAVKDYEVPPIPFPLVVGGFVDPDLNTFYNYIDYGTAGDEDLEPDGFFYNFPGGSGKFVLPRTSGDITDEGYHPHLIKGDNVKIKIYLVDEITATYRFEITDAFGTKYFFGTTEESTGGSAISSVSSYYSQEREDWLDVAGWQVSDEESQLNITTWHLDSIRSVKGDVIKFQYEKIGFTASTTSVEQRFARYDINQTVGVSANTYSGSVNQVVNLKEIEFDNGKVLFHTSSRKDLRSFSDWSNGNPWPSNEPTRLTGMTVKSLPDNTIIQKTDFYQSYYNSDKEDRADQYKFVRLKLDSLRVQEGKPSYKFSYNNSTLPSKESYNMDHWGYYNGANNRTLIPKKRFTNQDLNVHQGANRDANPQSAKQGNLSRIEYPTGGFTEFTYGGNVLRVFQKQIPLPDYEKDISLPKGSAQEKAAIAFYVESDDLPITWKVDAGYRGSFNCEDLFADLEGIEVFSGIIDNRQANLLNLANADKNTIIDITDPSILNNIEYAFEDNNGIVTEHYIPQDLSETCSDFFSGHDYDLSLEPGWYIFYAGKYDFTELSINAQLSYPSGFRTENRYAYGPGVRVEVVTTGGGQGPSQIKRYLYEGKDSEGNPKENSFLLSNPIYEYPYSWMHLPLDIFPLGPVYTPEAQSKYSCVTSESIEPLITTISGGYLGYRKVTEIYGNNGENGKIRYEYHPPGAGSSAIFGDYFLMKGIPFNTNPMGGKLKKSTQVDANNKILQETSITYGDIGSLDDPFFVYRGMRAPNADPMLSPEDHQVYVYNYIKYKLAYNTVLKSSETVKNYDPESGEYMISTTNYSYQDYDYSHNGNSYVSRNLMPVKVETTASNGVKTITVNRFPASYGNVTNDSQVSILNTMKSPGNNVVAPVVEQQVWKQHETETPKLIGGKFVGYGTDLLPEFIKSMILDQEVSGSPDVGPQSHLYMSGISYREDVHLEHDMEGNISKVTNRQGIETRYIYGYANTLPVIKADNAASNFDAIVESTDVLPNSYSSLEALIRSLDDIATDTTQQQVWKEFNQNLRGHTNTKNCMITTYTYKPLIGITSATDSRGYTMYYHYDSLNRLDYVTDDAGNLVSENEYNYKN